jgi:hypothetical protein
MFIRSVVADRLPRQGYIPAKETLDVQPKQTPKIIYAAVCILLCLTMLVLGVMGVARTGTIPKLLDLPPEYLPGSPKPRDVSCYTYTSEYIPRCSIHLLDNEVYFNFDTDTGTIITATVPARAYTIGQLIVSWGTPTGIIWNDYAISIYWGMHSALLYTHSIRPNSRVDFIVYDREQHTGSPWRGFRRHKY